MLVEIEIIALLLTAFILAMWNKPRNGTRVFRLSSDIDTRDLNPPSQPKKVK